MQQSENTRVKYLRSNPVNSSTVFLDKEQILSHVQNNTLPSKFEKEGSEAKSVIAGCSQTHGHFTPRHTIEITVASEENNALEEQKFS